MRGLDSITDLVDRSLRKLRGTVEVPAGGTSGNRFHKLGVSAGVGFWAEDKLCHNELHHFSSPCIGVQVYKRRGRVTDRRHTKRQGFDRHVPAPAARVFSLYPDCEREFSRLFGGGLGSWWSALGLDWGVVQL